MTCALIWGSTWLVIKFQIDSVSPRVGVFYRFILSSLILFALHFLLNRNLKFPKKFHLLFFLQGTCNFSLNYILTYLAETFSPSAVIALTFTILVHLNILGTWLFFKKPIHRQVVFGSLVGALGIYFLFHDDLQRVDINPEATWGVVLGLVATVFASTGNMLSYKNHLMKVPVMAGNAWGMFYGMLFTGFLCLILRDPFIVPTTLQFWSALVYLSVFGTVIAFGAYMTLVARIGAERAAYTTVMSPVVAVAISTFFENLKLTPWLIGGMLLCLIGNVLTLYKSGAAARTQEPPP